MPTTTRDACPTPRQLESRIQRLLSCDAERFHRLWAYYRNPMIARAVGDDDAGSGRPYRQAQEWGLPSRITGVRSGSAIDSTRAVGEVARKEVVIENDIGWRIETMVDYLFGKPIILNSAAPDPRRRAIIEELLRLIFAQAGGITFFQQLALMGAVYGFVDVLVKLDPIAPSEDLVSATCGTQDLGSARTDAIDAAESSTTPATAEPASGLATQTPKTGSSHPSLKALAALARRVRLEIVEPTRALPLLSCDDWRCVRAYAQVWRKSSGFGIHGSANAEQIANRPGFLHRLRDAAGRFIPHFAASHHIARRAFDETICVEVISRDEWKRYENDNVVAQGCNSLGQVPLVHIQNLALPFEYSGESDVEPLIPLQDEINTRLSDRGYRITMQSFKMYLGIGIDHFLEMPVGPGRMWHTDNENARLIEFGGDGRTFSEDNQIAEMREAMDKLSGVTPIVAGALKGRIGRLTSAAALRVTMLALLAKTERKRTTYGNGIIRICELALAWLDRAGLFHTSEDERRIEIHWPSPIPVNELERLEEARAKLNVGVPAETVLRELGY